MGQFLKRTPTQPGEEQPVGAQSRAQQGLPDAFVTTEWTQEDEILLGTRWRDSALPSYLGGVHGNVGHLTRSPKSGEEFGWSAMQWAFAKPSEIVKEVAMHLAPLGHDLIGVHSEHELFGALLKAVGHRSAVSHMSTAKEHHINHPWTAWRCEMGGRPARGALDRRSSVGHWTCRNWQTFRPWVWRCSKVGRSGHAKARCVVVGGP